MNDSIEPLNVPKLIEFPFEQGTCHKIHAIDLRIEYSFNPPESLMVVVPPTLLNRLQILLKPGDSCPGELCGDHDTLRERIVVGLGKPLLRIVIGWMQYKRLRWPKLDLTLEGTKLTIEDLFFHPA